jgi:molecular chaperone DnaK
MDFTPLRIRLPFGSEDEFIARYGVHVGRDGFFLATRTPKDVGVRLAFELVLADGTPLLSGEGVVARTVEGARAGMVVRFVRLDGAGAALVERILQARNGPDSPPTPSSKATTWLGDPTRDVARVTGAAGGRPPAKAEEVAKPAPPKPRSGSPHDAPTWPGDPTRDVVRFASVEDNSNSAPTWPGDPTRDVVRFAAVDRPAKPPVPRPDPHPLPEAPPPKAMRPDEVPIHLRPTPALGIPEAQAAADRQLHTAVTPVRGTPALGPEVVAFLTGKTPVRDSKPHKESPPPAAKEAQAKESLPASGETPAALPPEKPKVPPPVLAPVEVETLRKPPEAAPAEAVAKKAVYSADAFADTVRIVPPPPDVIALPAPSTVKPLPPRPAVQAPPSPPPPAAAPSVEAPRTQKPSAEDETQPAAEARTAPSPSSAQKPEATAVPLGTTEAGLAQAVLGLDVGTASARMAWAHEGKVDVLAVDAEGTVVLPCRLGRDSHGVLRVLQPGEPEEALWVGSPVTLLGTRADSPAVRTLVRRWPVPVVADERGEVAFDWAGVTVTAVELVATLLRSLRASAEKRTGRNCTQGVLVVPVAFTLLQRARFREAAERAGLTVLRLLNAPTAAALAFAQDKGLARRRVLVWRMGAATSDAAVVAVSGNDLDVVSTGGDGALGGINFDEQLALGLDKTARTDPARLRVRVAQAERCKLTLSKSEKGLLPPAVAGEAPLEVTRADLELRTSALVERSVLLAQDVLKAAGLSAENLDALVLSGGMAQLPHLRRAVESAFSKTSAEETDVASGPALGAALLGAALSAPAVSGRARSNVVEVLGVPLEAVAPEFGHQRAFERNTRLPAEKTLPLTLAANQPLEVQLFQGMARAPDPRSFLGLLQSPGVDRGGEWALHLGLSADGLLTAAVTPPGGKRRPLSLQAAPAPQEAEAVDASMEDTDTGARLLGGLKRLFSKK